MISEPEKQANLENWTNWENRRQNGGGFLQEKLSEKDSLFFRSGAVFF